MVLSFLRGNRPQFWPTRRACYSLVAATSLALLSGCIPLTQQNEPRSPLLPNFPANFSQSDKAQQADGQVQEQAGTQHAAVPQSPVYAPQWWRDFNDPQLESLIERALSGNYSLLASRDKIAAAAAASRQTRASLLPTINAEAFGGATANLKNSTSSESYSAGLAASYELDLWNRLGSLNQAGLRELQATRADYQAATISLSGETATLWYRLQEKLLQTRLLTGQRETNRQILALIDVQFRAGKVPITDVLQQRQLIETNSGDINGLRSDVRVLTNSLALLLGETAVEFTGATESTQGSDLGSLHSLPSLPPLPQLGIPAETLLRRPDLQAAFLRLQAADDRVSSAVANQWPKLSLSGEISTSGDSTRDLFNNWFGNLAANLLAPIFDGGSRKAAVDEQQALAAQLLNSYRQTLLSALAEVEESLIEEQRQQELLASLSRRLELASDTVSRLSTRYRLGAADYQEVLLALRSQQGLEQSILASRRLLLEARISLCRAISGPLPGADVEGASGSQDQTTTPADIATDIAPATDITPISSQTSSTTSGVPQA